MRIRILIIGVLAASILWGQEAPGRVGQLSYLYGSVSFRPGIIEEWAPATLNYPLSNGDHLWTDHDAQAEVRVGLTAVHLAPETGFFISLLDDRAFRIGAAEGALNIRIPRMNEGETVEVETPYGLFRLLRTGSYRVDVQPDGDYASLTVRSGAGEAVAGTQTYGVDAGKRVVLSGNPATVESMDAPSLDPWDEWCAARDEAEERDFDASQQYVSWEISGAADFGQYGDWESDATYGPCWGPRNLPPGWAPFRFGHWVYKAPWGWTWVDDAPWGFAPSHWGRWVRIGDRWVWVPDPRHAPTRYAPAVVAFSSTRGSRFVSWIPLAPGERADSRMKQYRNRDAMTAAQQADFAASRPIGPTRVVVIDRGATTFGDRTAEIMPTRESLLGGTPRAGGPPARQNPEPVAAAPEVHPAPAEIPRRPITDPVDRTERVGPIHVREDDEVDRRRVVEQERADESRRQAEEQRAVESRRQAEEQRRNEERRRAEDSRRQEEQHRVQENRRQEVQRRAEESRRQDEQRRADESRRAEDNRRAEQTRQQEAQHRADENRRQDEQRKSDEQQRSGKK
jgi:hypothetical protein